MEQIQNTECQSQGFDPQGQTCQCPWLGQHRQCGSMEQILNTESQCQRFDPHGQTCQNWLHGSREQTQNTECQSQGFWSTGANLPVPMTWPASTVWLHDADSWASRQPIVPFLINWPGLVGSHLEVGCQGKLTNSLLFSTRKWASAWVDSRRKLNPRRCRVLLLSWRYIQTAFTTTMAPKRTNNPNPTLPSITVIPFVCAIIGVVGHVYSRFLETAV